MGRRSRRFSQIGRGGQRISAFMCARTDELLYSARERPKECSLRAKGSGAPGVGGFVLDLGLLAGNTFTAGDPFEIERVRNIPIRTFLDEDPELSCDLHLQQTMIPDHDHSTERTGVRVQRRTPANGRTPCGSLNPLLTKPEEGVGLPLEFDRLLDADTYCSDAGRCGWCPEWD